MNITRGHITAVEDPAIVAKWRTIIARKIQTIIVLSRFERSPILVLPQRISEAHLTCSLFQLLDLLLFGLLFLFHTVLYNIFLFRYLEEVHFIVEMHSF